jgi:hypothetical protein
VLAVGKAGFKQLVSKKRANLLQILFDPIQICHHSTCRVCVGSRRSILPVLVQVK